MMQMRSRPGFDTPVRTPPRSLDDIDGRGGWSGDGLQMVSRDSVGGAGRSGNGLQMVSRVAYTWTGGAGRSGAGL